MRRESASCQSTIELTDRRFRWHCLSVSSNGLPPRSRSLGRTITQTAASERPDCQRYWLYINFLVNNVVFVVVILSVSLYRVVLAEVQLTRHSHFIIYGVVYKSYDAIEHSFVFRSSILGSGWFYLPTIICAALREQQIIRLKKRQSWRCQ